MMNELTPAEVDAVVKELRRGAADYSLRSGADNNGYARFLLDIAARIKGVPVEGMVDQLNADLIDYKKRVA